MAFKLDAAETGIPLETTRRQLLDAAAEVFARVGFRAATVREICQRAGANIAAVNYHFGDKEALYSEVLTQALRRAREKYPPDLGLGAAAKPEERLHAFILSFLLRIFDEGAHAVHGKLMAREMVEPTGALDRLVKQEIGPMAGTLAGISRELLGRGASEKQVRLCGMSVVSQVLFYHHCRPVVKRLFPGMKFGAREIEALGRHITEFSLAAFSTLSRRKPRPTLRKRRNAG